MTRAIVTGSRDWSNESMIERALATLPTGSIVVHGDAPGADRIAARIAQRMGHTVESFPARWRQYGKAAGPIRNQLMVDAGADMCHAFPGPESVGTWDCVERARRAGIPVTVWQT